MGRTKLSDSEREMRKKQRTKKLFSSYKTYSDGPRGSKEQWAETAKLILSLNTNVSHLAVLGLSQLPKSLEELNKARKKAMLTAHPDKGGVNEHAVKINEAYENIKASFSKKSFDRVSFHDGSDDIELARATHIEHVDLKNLWIDRNYINDRFIAEKKYDGSRYGLYLGSEGRLKSKRVSTVTKKYVDKSDHCPHLTKIDLPKKFWGTVLDGEIVHPHREKSEATTSIMGCNAQEAVERQKKYGWVKFYVYDVPKLKGDDLRDQPLSFRKEKLKSLVKELKKYIPVEYVEHVPSSEAEDFFKDQAEGIMLKDLNAKYGDGWFKVKKTVTWDVVIMGYTAPKKTSKKSDGTISTTSYHERGLIGAIVFGAYKNGKLVELGTVSGMDETIRKKLSTNGKSYIGKVIEIRFFERTQSGALKQARFVKFRDDKSAIQCVDTEF